MRALTRNWEEHHIKDYRERVRGHEEAIPPVITEAFKGIDADGHVDTARAPMFWDSRAHGLEEQALIPIESLEEMRGERGGTGGGVAAAVARVGPVRK